MATAQQNLQTAYDNIAARLAEVTACPKPTYTVDGETWNWTEYVQMLTTQQSLLLAQIQAAGGPFEVRSQGMTG